MTVIKLVGRKRGHDRYAASDWHERDNFMSLGQAEGYAGYLSRMHTATPYRIVRYEPEDRDPRPVYAVEYVPEWKLVVA